MPTIPNRLVPFMQAFACAVILILFVALAVMPMFGFKEGDPSMVETEKAIVLILVGFLFGSSAASGKKDDTNAALTAQLLAPPSPPPAPPAPPKTT